MKFFVAGTALLIAALAHATDLIVDGERDLVRVPTDGTTCCDLGYACVHDNGAVCVRPYRLDSPNWAGLCPPGSSPADCACENTKAGNRRDEGCGTPKICAGPDGEPLSVANAVGTQCVCTNDTKDSKDSGCTNRKNYCRARPGYIGSACGKKENCRFDGKFDNKKWSRFCGGGGPPSKEQP